MEKSVYDKLVRYIVDQVVPMMDILGEGKESLESLELEFSEVLNAYYAKFPSGHRPDFNPNLIESASYAPVIAALLRMAVGYEESGCDIVRAELADRSIRWNAEEKVRQANRESIDRIDTELDKAGWVLMYKELTTNHYRFGKTTNLRKRAQGIVNSVPSTIDFVYCVFTEDADELNMHLFEAFSRSRHENGWYALTESDVDYFKNGLPEELARRVVRVENTNVPVDFFPSGTVTEKWKKLKRWEYVQSRSNLRTTKDN